MEENIKMDKRPTFSFGLLLKGLAMGLAEIIPGVSGGTIAFITGIYEELLNTIKGVNLNLFKILRKEGLASFWKQLNGAFLVKLLGGMFVGIVIGIFLIGYLLEHYQAPLWAFFFGLIISSAIYIARQIDVWNGFNVLLVIIGAVVAYTITLLSPAEGSSNYLIVLLSGMVAISALILPGISGSFILVLLGMYTIIRSEAERALRSFELDSIMIIAVFGVGCILGLAFFSRFLSFTFKNYKNQTLAILTGFMIGSLNKIWPWRNPVSWLDKSTESIVTDLTKMDKVFLLGDDIRLINEANVLPGDYLFFEAQFGLCILTFLVGLAIVFVLDQAGKNKE